MYKMTIILCLFLASATGGCIHGPDEEMGTDFRKDTVEWPSSRTAPQEKSGPRQTLEQR